MKPTQKFHRVCITPKIHGGLIGAKIHGILVAQMPWIFHGALHAPWNLIPWGLHADKNPWKFYVVNFHDLHSVEMNSMHFL